MTREEIVILAEIVSSMTHAEWDIFFRSILQNFEKVNGEMKRICKPKQAEATIILIRKKGVETT